MNLERKGDEVLRQEEEEAAFMKNRKRRTARKDKTHEVV